jgi:hypothetical protein
VRAADKIELTATVLVRQHTHDLSGALLCHRTVGFKCTHPAVKQTRDLVDQHWRRGRRMHLREQNLFGELFFSHGYIHPFNFIEI